MGSVFAEVFETLKTASIIAIHMSHAVWYLTARQGATLANADVTIIDKLFY